MARWVEVPPADVGLARAAGCQVAEANGGNGTRPSQDWCPVQNSCTLWRVLRSAAPSRWTCGSCTTLTQEPDTQFFMGRAVTKHELKEIYSCGHPTTQPR